jgi:hypothetical protein
MESVAAGMVSSDNRATRHLFDHSNQDEIDGRARLAKLALCVGGPLINSPRGSAVMAQVPSLELRSNRYFRYC